MGKPPVQSDVRFESPNIDHEQDMVENGANTGATKAVYIVIAILFVVFLLLVGVGLHIPSGG